MKLSRIACLFLVSLTLASLFLLPGCCCPTQDWVSGGNNGTIGLPTGGIQGITLGGKAKWTIIVVQNGDNNIEEPVLTDLLEMEKVGSTKDVNILVQLDRSPKYYTGNGDWSGARRFHVIKGDGINIASPVIANLGNVDSADPQTIISFASWAIDNYPADRYVLILEDHGGGWTGMNQDETSNSDMSLAEMKQALAGVSTKLGRKIDLVVFDMCLMAQYDVMLDTAPYADYMVASEEIVPGYSFPYDNVMADITANPTMGPVDFSTVFVDRFAEFYYPQSSATTMSSIDLSKTPALQAAFNDFSTQLKRRAESNWSEVAEMHLFAEYYAMGMPEARIFSFGDMKDFASNAQAYSLNDPQLNASAATLQQAVDNAVIANYAHPKHPRSAGISYYFQPSNGIYELSDAGKYPQTTAYQQQPWSDFLQMYYSRANMPLTAPSLSSFSASPTASLVRPLDFSFTLTGNNIVTTQWYQFTQRPNGDVELMRIIGQRSQTRLPNGKQVNGYSGGTGQFIGKSSPMEFRITDGTRSSRATIQQLWPSEDSFGAQGILKMAGGGECNAVLYFNGYDGKAAQALCINQVQGGGTYVSAVPLSNGDIFTPAVYKLYGANLTAGLADQLTYSSQNGFELEWAPLTQGVTYLVAVEAQDVQQQTAFQSTQFAASKQPVLNPLVSSEMSGNWECGELYQGLTITRIMTLNLTLTQNGGCKFSDSSGNFTCTFEYSSAGAPHVYLYVNEWRESIKFFYSRRTSDSFWLFDLAGSIPLFCQRGGSGRPTVDVYRELYNSVGDAGSDLDELQNDTSKLTCKWQNTAKGISFDFKQDGSFTWITSGTTITGTYSATSQQMTLTPSGQSQPITFYYLLGNKKLVLVDEYGGETVAYKPGYEPTQQNTGITPTPQPTPPQPQANAITGNWIDMINGATLILAPDGNYAWISPYYYEYGTYSVSGDVITFNSMGMSVQYYYRLDGSTLIVYNSLYTFAFVKGA